MPEQIQPGQFSNLMPDMSDEEFDALKQSIERDGLKHPIEVTPGGIIIDGHHRFKACQELDVEPETVTVEDTTVEAAIRANLTRRNLNDGTKREVVENYLEEHYDGEATQREIAESLGVSVGTVNRAWKTVQPVEQLSKEEKRYQVATYLGEHPDATNREVAENVEADVSHATVGNWRNEWTADDADAELDALDTTEPVTPETTDNPLDVDETRSDSSAEEGEALGDVPEDEVGELTYPDEDDDDTEGSEPEPVEADDDPAPEPGPEPAPQVAELKAVIGDLNQQLDEVKAENDRLRQQPEPEGGGASERVLRRMVNERNAALREFIQAVDRQDTDAIFASAERARGLVDVDPGSLATASGGLAG